MRQFHTVLTHCAACVRLRTCVAFGFPYGPHFERVDFASALNAFVADVVTHVVILVALKKVRGAQRMALPQQSAFKTTQAAGEGKGEERGRGRGGCGAFI